MNLIFSKSNLFLNAYCDIVNAIGPLGTSGPLEGSGHMETSSVDDISGIQQDWEDILSIIKSTYPDIEQYLTIIISLLENKVEPSKVLENLKSTYSPEAKLVSTSPVHIFRLFEIINYLDIPDLYELILEDISSNLDLWAPSTIECFHQIPLALREDILKHKRCIETVLRLDDEKKYLSTKLLPFLDVDSLNLWYVAEFKKCHSYTILYLIDEKKRLCSTVVFDLICEHGHLRMAQLLHERGIRGTSMSMNCASENGHLDVVRFLHSIGTNCTFYAMNAASRNGYLDVVQFLHSVGKDCTTYAMDLASEFGHLEVVKFLHSIGKDCTTNAMDWASEKGHLQVVRFLHSIGKDCTTNAIYWAFQNGHLDIARFLHSIGKS